MDTPRSKGLSVKPKVVGVSGPHVEGNYLVRQSVLISRRISLSYGSVYGVLKGKKIYFLVIFMTIDMDTRS